MKDFPKNDVWLARGKAVQILHMLVAASTNFPEKAHYRERLFLTVHIRPRPTLLVKSLRPISNTRGVRVTSSMDSVSLAFERCL
jgi:hypothetical protein